MCMLRSLILMVAHKITSLTDWANLLKTNDLLAVLSGFTPDNTPSVGCFYDFWNRLWLEDARLRKENRRRLRRKKKKAKKTKKGQKLSNRRPGVCRRLLKSFKKHNGFPSKKRPNLLLQMIFTVVFVKKSIEKGILPEKMQVAGDGFPFETASNPYGIRECGCREKGIYRCECPRRYSDPYANWGWDSSRNLDFHGRNVYTVTCVNGKYELPVNLRFGQGSRHDGPLSMFTIVESADLLNRIDAKMTTWIADSAHDNHAIYSLLEHLNITAVIDLNKKPPLGLDEKLFETDGTPLCPGMHPMINWGYESKRSRTKWRCRRLAGKKDIRESVQCNLQCGKPEYGKTRYVHRDRDLRAFPAIPRGTEQWKKLYKKRSGSGI